MNKVETMQYKNISVQELKAMLDRGDDIELLDVRENYERDIVHIGGLHIPMGHLNERWFELDKEKKMVVYCHHGIRSASVCEALSQQVGFTNVFNLEGGIAAWTKEIDPNLAGY